MIAAAAPRRATALAAGVLLAALVRGMLQPFGDLPAMLGFVVAMAGVLAVSPPSLTLPPTFAREGRVFGVAAGVATGLVLLLPVMGAGASGRALSGFWGWGAAVVLVATLEEVVIRGRLQPAWTAEGGPMLGMLASAAVFGLIHLPRYGLAALPLDFAVGLALAGLRAVTGRVAPCAIAHVIADWGAWFWL